MTAQHPHYDAAKLDWFKSSYSSGDNNCLETAVSPGVVPVRDSKTPQGPVLAFSTSTWSLFVEGLKSSEA